MERVKRRSRFSDNARLYAAIFLVYFLGAIAFIYFGLQPANTPEEVYAAEAATADTELNIPALSLNLPVSKVTRIGSDLQIPEQIVGSYSLYENKTLLMGHSSTAFKDLKNLELNQELSYADKTYVVTNIEIKEKTAISMKELLQPEEKDTIVLMTCAGEPIKDSVQDYTHRLLITAESVTKNS